MPKHSGVSRFLQNYAGKMLDSDDCVALPRHSIYGLQRKYLRHIAQCCILFSDVTINEFANSNVVPECKRIRKKNVHAIKEIPLHVDNDAIVLDDEEDDNVVTNKMANLKLKASTDGVVDVEHVYSTYPNDVWYLISEFIQPEDVLRFALICKQTYAITTTMKFWRTLYKRHYNDRIELPVRLKPDCMARPGGIRACSIRSLYFTYAPFVQRLLKQPKQDFHLLTKRYVERFWFSQITGTKWQYFYKLKRRPMPGGRCAESEALHRRNPRCLKSMRDVYLNSEEGCALLVVSIHGSMVDLSTLKEETNRSPSPFLRLNRRNFIHCLVYRTKWKLSTISH